MMKNRVRASLFIATYELPRHLELVCAGLERQSMRQSELEILFCDDGSGLKTRCIIEAFQKRVPFPVQHFWQEHQGFRKCKILNQAIRESRGDILIFLDGDCIPHQKFVEDHIRQQEEGYYLAGRRVELGKILSEWLTPERVRKGLLDFPSYHLFWSAIKKDSKNIQRSVRIPWQPLRQILGMDQIDDLKGCNFSVKREVMLTINGFDEAYEGYGREDTDVEIRLQNLGLKPKSMKGLALQFHIWHPRREFTPFNDDRLEELKREHRIQCVQGLDQRLPIPK